MHAGSGELCGHPGAGLVRWGATLASSKVTGIQSSGPLSTSAYCRNPLMPMFAMTSLNEACSICQAAVAASRAQQLWKLAAPATAPSSYTTALSRVCCLRHQVQSVVSYKSEILQILLKHLCYSMIVRSKPPLTPAATELDAPEPSSQHAVHLVCSSIFRQPVLHSSICWFF